MTDALCLQCHDPIDTRVATRVYNPQVAGCRIVVCSRQCGQQWLQGNTEEPVDPDDQYHIRPEPDTRGVCGCGCGAEPKRGRYLPGHDSQLAARRKKENT